MSKIVSLAKLYDKKGNFARFTYATDRTPIQMDYKEKSETINRYNREA